jgi:hypothetical protein
VNNCRTLVRRVAVLLLLTCAAAPVAAADTPEKRAVPDYDGRGERPTTTTEGILWVPRVILFPAWVVTEYVLRKPLGFLITTAEKEEWPTLIFDFFTFDEANTVGFFPTFLVDFGLAEGTALSGGGYFFWDDAGAKGHQIRLSASTGGKDWVQVRYADRLVFDDWRFGLLIRRERRRDWLYGGSGKSGRRDLLSAYGRDTTEGGLSARVDIGTRSFVQTSTVVRHSGFFGGGCCDVPRLDDRIADGLLPTPPGYDDGFTAFVWDVNGAWDTRKHRPGSESGVRIDVTAGLGVDLLGGDSGWVRYGATVGGFADLYNNRVLGLIVGAEMADPWGDTDVPFTELPALGGGEVMAHLREGTLRGRSAVHARLDYRWPIWVFLDGWLFSSVGNTYGAHLEDFDFESLRVSFGLGIRTANPEDHPFQLIVAGGTTPIGDGAGFDTLRVVFGTTSGF